MHSNSFVVDQEAFDALENLGFITDTVYIHQREGYREIGPIFTAEYLISRGFAVAGTKIIFEGVNGGDYHLNFARDRGLVKDQIYTVKKCHVGDWSSDYELEEMGGRFNTVMFGKASVDG